MDIGIVENVFPSEERQDKEGNLYRELQPGVATETYIRRMTPEELNIYKLAINKDFKLTEEKLSCQLRKKI